MLAHLNNHNLDALKVDRRFYLFFQVWKELTDERTIDSYKYRIMNSLSIIQELIRVIDFHLRGYHQTTHNIDDCCGECLDIVKRDSVMRAHYPVIWLELVNKLGKKVGSDSQLRALSHHLEYSYRMLLPNYLNHLISELKISIDSGNQEQTVEYTRMLISNCASNGWSTPALRELIDVLEGSVNSTLRWDDFKRKLEDRSKKEFDVFVPLYVNYRSKSKQSIDNVKRVVNESIQNMGLEIRSPSQDTTLREALEKLRMPQNRSYVLVRSEAFDPYSACMKAIETCSSVLNMLSFYNYITPWDSSNTACCIIEPATDIKISLEVGKLHGSVANTVNNKKAFDASREYLLEQNSSIATKLRASFAYSSMGRASGSQEEKFMSNWVALESLCRGDAYDNIISNVLETVPPALCARYIYRLFRNFLEDCKRCDLEFESISQGCSLRESTTHEERISALIALFNDDRAYAELQEGCAINDLLSFRCKAMHKIATDSEKMYSLIERHHLTVRRQLSRLYRIRNEIAHMGGMATGSLELYTEHLVNYLTSFVLEFATCAYSKSESNADNVFAMMKDNYQSFVDLKSGKHRQIDAPLVLGRLLSSGIIDLI